MRRSTLPSLAAAVLGGSLLVLGGSVGAAVAAPCEGYSGACPTEAPVVPRTVTPSGQLSDGPGLAATGSEVALLTAVGLGAVAGGTALVLAARRPRSTQPA